MHLPNLLIAFENDNLLFGATTNPYDWARMRARASGSLGHRQQSNHLPGGCRGLSLSAGGWAERLGQVWPRTSPYKAAAVACYSSTSALPSCRPAGSDVKEGAAIIARGNILNRMTLPEVPKRSPTAFFPPPRNRQSQGPAPQK